MAIFRKLYQPLWSWNRKVRISGCSLARSFANTRKVISLDTIIANNADVYNTILKGNLSKTDWQNIREKIEAQTSVTTATVDATIIDMCLNEFQIDSAIAYFKFLKENNYPIHAAIIGKYLRLYVLKRDALTDSDKIEILNTYNTLREKYPYLDSVTSEHCITSLCLTDQWEKSLEIIETMKMSGFPGTSVYSALAGAAFRNESINIGWKALSEIVSRKLIPQAIAYRSYLQYCEKVGKTSFNDKVEEMFKFWSEYSLMPYAHIITAYVDIATKYGWSGTPITISEKGKCKHCRQTLSKITFDDNSFQELEKSIMNKVIIGRDIYRKTNPKELQRFNEFIQETKPYDIVIDGLNLVHIKNRKKPSLQTLINVVEYFKRRDKKILVVTRKHQEKSPTFQIIRQQAHVFLVDNLSADDPYIINATLASGRNAMFVSLDLMRQYKHSLQDPHLQREFKKWQYSHQYFLNTMSNYIRVEKPLIYMPTAQKNGNGWHIPYVNDDCTSTESLIFPDKWYCLKYNGKD